MTKAFALFLICGLIIVPLVMAGTVTEAGVTMSANHEYLNIPFETITGDTATLGDFEGKVVLLVNVASECGNTPQYAGLEGLYEKYREKGFEVIGFPANNFGEQEPGSNAEILKFCTSKYNVKFPMMAKVSVAGENKHPLFSYLTEGSNIPGEIQWNFSKFLFDRRGNLVARFSPKVEPSSTDIVSEVEKNLK